MRHLILCFLLGMGGVQLGYAQILELQFQLIDESSAAPIADAHVFISDASIGTTSDLDGRCELKVTAQETQVLIITHVSYETLVIGPERYRLLLDGAPVEMQNNGIDLSEIRLTAKRSGQWKRNFRKFSKALLGEGKAAACEILNPEVLRFEEKEGAFRATAIDLLEIENDYLGYKIRFWLAELTIDADGSMQYKGNGRFIDESTDNQERYDKRREQVYRNSLPHFLRSLQRSIQGDALQDYGYQIALEQYADGTFNQLFEPKPEDLLQLDTLSGIYQLRFPEFLTVKHTTLKVVATDEKQVSISGAEQQRFGSGRSQSIGADIETMAVSRLYKIAPLLLFDQRGNIINKAVVKEYGYWATQRLATTLPVDYKSFTDWTDNEPTANSFDTLRIFQHLVGGDSQKKKEAIVHLRQHWSRQYVAPLLDILRLSSDDELVRAIQTLLQEHIPEMETNYYSGLQWLWKNTPNYGSYYADFKAYLYRTIDPVFAQYFERDVLPANIRLDEIVWGGVRQDGIPPLRSPKMLAAEEAGYLADTDVVFGLLIDGVARAYPMRILAWHEFFTDDIAGRSIAGVYCTLCGTVIIYDAAFEGVRHELGTSGFLYRSNKLMYDRATQSLWSTMLGQPVVGPLVGQNIELSILPVETTSWGEWRSRYPNTEVLSLETGYARNYDEGEAYSAYFADDELMFPVPRQDGRLANKARVFVPRPDSYATDPLAISVDYLRRKGLHQDQIGDQPVLIITENTGASRVYAINGQQFGSYEQGVLIDKSGQEWAVSETAIIGPNVESLLQLPAHEAFWFAWFNVFPETRVVY